MAVCPFADQSRRYDGRYPGGYVSGFGFRGLLHSTESTGLPSYSGGAVAPHFTVDPRTGRIWQHYDTSRPSRALKHPGGTVDTNNARCIQIEIIAYSDKAIAARVGGLHVEALTPAQLAPIAKVMRWVEATHGVRRASVAAWKSYPASAGTGNGIRMSTAAWRAFDAWCGHEHAPNNDHGDPSSIAITALLGQVAQEEDPLASLDDDTLRNLGNVADRLAAPASDGRSTLDALLSALARVDAAVGKGKGVDELTAKVDRQAVDLAALAEKVNALVAVAPGEVTTAYTAATITLSGKEA